MILPAYAVAVGAALGFANLVAAARRSYFSDIAKAARVEPTFKDFRAMFRSDGMRQRAAFRVCGYGWLATSCTAGLILFGAANTLRCSLASDIAVIVAFIGAVVGLHLRWHFLDRSSLATENFDVYHSGFGRSFESFEVALERFRPLRSEVVRDRFT